jgi:hypothetical protein
MEFPFMTPRSLQLTAFLALLAWPVMSHAQETSAKEDERIEQLVRSEASEWYAPKNSVTVGFRLLSSGSNVHFGNLGSIPFSAAIDQSIPGNRVYDNGYVNADSPAAGERDANGNQISQPGGRFKTYNSQVNVIYDSAGNAIGTETVQVLASDSLSYTPGLTRSWSYSTPEQATSQPGYIGMTAYNANSEGGAFSGKQGPSGGVELVFNHALRKFGKRTELSFVTGLGINGINDKVAGDVTSTLGTYTDYYSLNGQPAPVTLIATPYVAPSLNSDGKTDSTVPLTATPDHTTNTTTPGGVTVHGRWQVKGAYFMMRVGPSIRTQVTEHFGLSASLCLAGAYAGTTYSAVESMEVPLIGTTISVPPTPNDATKFLGGYYADFNMEWNANDTMGLFGGVSAQKFGDYTQTLGERTARIDLGGGVGLRGGLNIKF